jgi:hypothetical protein
MDHSILIKQWLWETLFLLLPPSHILYRFHHSLAMSQIRLPTLKSLEICKSVLILKLTQIN